MTEVLRQQLGKLEWLPPQVAAEILGLSAQRVNQLSDSGRLWSLRNVRGGRLFLREDVEALAKTRRR